MDDIKIYAHDLLKMGNDILFVVEKVKELYRLDDYKARVLVEEVNCLLGDWD
jgi:hypothetical protein